MDDLVVCTVELYAETDTAILVGEPGQQRNSIYASRDQKWIPLSFITHSTLNGVGSVGEIELPRWMAEKKDLAHDEE
jgi:hypothetical protein